MTKIFITNMCWKIDQLPIYDENRQSHLCHEFVMEFITDMWWNILSQIINEYFYRKSYGKNDSLKKIVIEIFILSFYNGKSFYEYVTNILDW